MMWSRCVAPSWWFYPEQCQAGHPWRTRQGHRVLVALRLRGRPGRPAARPRPPDGAVRGAGLHGLRLILNGDELKIGSPALARRCPVPRTPMEAGKVARQGIGTDRHSGNLRQTNLDGAW